MSSKMLSLGILFLLSPFVLSDGASVKFIGLLQNLLDQNFSEAPIDGQCKSDLLVVKTALDNRELWALKLLDSSGHIGSDYIWGNNVFIGSPVACKSIDNMDTHFTSQIARSQPPMAVGYRVSHISHWSENQIGALNFGEKVLNFGFCVPISCGVKDIHHLVGILLQDSEFYNATLIGQNTHLIKTKEVGLENEFFQSTSLWILMSCLCLVLGLTCLQSLVDFYAKKEIGYAKKYDTNNDEAVVSKTSRWEKVLQCFSLRTNIKAMTTMELGSDHLSPIHGIKVIGASSLILGHIVAYGVTTFRNKYHFLSYKTVIWAQPLMISPLHVDTFFAISGVLVSYTFFQHAKRKCLNNPVTTFYQAVLGRYLRLTPLYALSMLMAIVLAQFLNSVSIYHQADDNEENCSRLWVLNLLYINNFAEITNLCMTWSWYLSADFQCYTVSIALLVIYNWNKFIGRIAFVTTFVIFTGINGYLGYTMLSGITSDNIYANFKYLYVPFWSRINVFLVGVYAGKFLSDNNKTINIKKRSIATGWAGSIISLIFVTFIHAFHVVSPLLLLMYMAFARTLWGLSISWIIVACTTGKGGIVNKILSAKMFIPLSRMTYSVYLINPIWIYFILMTNRDVLYLDFPILVVLAMGFIVTTFMIAFVFTIFLDIPCSRLTKIFY